MAMDNSELKIGIFGGCFDPVHIGHLIIAETSRQQFLLNKVIFVPAGIPPHRGMPFASAKHRFEMVKLATRDNPFFDVSDIEIDKNEVSYTWDTMMTFQKMFLAKFFLIVGWDTFSILPSWRNGEKLAEKFSFIVAPRITEKKEFQTFPFEVKYSMLEIPRMEISSSLIREKIKKGESIRYLVPDRVLDYIVKENLYV